MELNKSCEHCGHKEVCKEHIESALFPAADFYGLIKGKFNDVEVEKDFTDKVKELHYEIASLEKAKNCINYWFCGVSLLRRKT